MANKLLNFFKDEEGATAVEYGIMVAAIAAVIITVVIAVGTSTNNAFESVRNNMTPLGGSWFIKKNYGANHYVDGSEIFSKIGGLAVLPFKFGGHFQSPWKCPKSR